jgi:ribosomal protein S27AE
MRGNTIKLSNQNVEQINTFKSQCGNKTTLSNHNAATKQHFQIKMWQQNNTFKSKCGNTITLSNHNAATKQHFQIEMWQHSTTFSNQNVATQ